ncbi:tail protein X [Klebsiella aerogenes]
MTLNLWKSVCCLHLRLVNLSFTVTQVLEANRELADQDAIYPAGIMIILPDLVPPVDDSPFSLWD